MKGQFYSRCQHEASAAWFRNATPALPPRFPGQDYPKGVTPTCGATSGLTQFTVRTHGINASFEASPGRAGDAVSPPRRTGHRWPGREVNVRSIHRKPPVRRLSYASHMSPVDLPAGTGIHLVTRISHPLHARAGRRAPARSDTRAGACPRRPGHPLSRRGTGSPDELPVRHGWRDRPPPHVAEVGKPSPASHRAPAGRAPPTTATPHAARTRKARRRQAGRLSGKVRKTPDDTRGTGHPYRDTGHRHEAFH